MASRSLLDTGKAANDQLFWEKVLAAFIKQDDNYDVIRFQEDNVFAAGFNVNTSAIVLHDWKKLRSIWKAVNVEYKAALTRFTQSGTHDSSFTNFCNRKPDFYYLRKYLELRPNLNNTVEADLPEDCAILSDVIGDFKGSVGSSSKRKQSENDVAEAIRDIPLLQCNQSWQSNGCFTWKKKIVGAKMELRQKHAVLFEEWEKSVSHLRSLHQDLCGNRFDEVTKAELEDDINGLVQQKNMLASQLGLK